MTGRRGRREGKNFASRENTTFQGTLPQVPTMHVLQKNFDTIKQQFYTFYCRGSYKGYIIFPVTMCVSNVPMLNLDSDINELFNL